MDRHWILEQLELAEKHVLSGEQLLSRERTLLEQMQRDGHDTTRGEGLLKKLEESQKMHLEHLQELRRELAETE